MASGRLNLHERYRIHALLEARYNIRTIALILDRSPSTISRELRRNGAPRGYCPDSAQRAASLRRIAGRTGLASHEWIYRHVYADQRRGGLLFRYLRRRRKQRRRRGLLQHRRHWTQRPAVDQSTLLRIRVEFARQRKTPW